MGIVSSVTSSRCQEERDREGASAVSWLLLPPPGGFDWHRGGKGLELNAKVLVRKGEIRRMKKNVPVRNSV